MGNALLGNKGGSRNRATVVADTAIEVMQRNIARCVTAATQEQLMEIRDVGGDVVIDGTSMMQASTVDMRCALSSQMQSDIQSEIAAKLSQYAESNGIALLSALGGSSADVETEIMNLFDASVEMSNLQEAVMQSLQSQRVVVGNVGGNVTIANTTMTQSLKMVAEAMVEYGGYSTAISQLQADIDQAAKTTDTGPLDSLFDTIKSSVNSWIFLVIGVALIGGIVLLFAMKYLFTTETGAALVADATAMAQQAM